MDKEILILGKEAFDKLKPDVQRFIKQQSQCITDLETKLAESEAKVASREDEIKFKEADINQLKWFLEGKNKDIDQLKQQLAEKNQAIESLQEINQSLGQTCNNDAKEIDRLRERLKKEIK